MAHQSQDSQAFLQRAYALDGASAASALYDEWAERYDTHLSEMDYTFPESAVRALTTVIGEGRAPEQLQALDAGCGTGLVGILMSRKGFKTIDGLDISVGMLQQARKTGAYHSLNQADLTQPLDCEDERYHVAMCVGTFTKGHVGPEPAFTELIRVVKKHGHIVATILDEIWESGGFKTKVDALTSLGEVSIIQSSVIGITKDSAEGGRILVLEKL